MNYTYELSKQIEEFLIKHPKYDSKNIPIIKFFYESASISNEKYYIIKIDNTIKEYPEKIFKEKSKIDLLKILYRIIYDCHYHAFSTQKDLYDFLFIELNNKVINSDIVEDSSVKELIKEIQKKLDKLKDSL